MKKITYIYLLFLFFSFNIHAQSNFIIAGQHSSNDYYYDFVPDTTIQYICTNSCIDYFYVDINHDGINDFLFALNPGTGCLGCNPQSNAFCYIKGINNNKVAIGMPNNACNPNTMIAHNFNLNDTINSNSNWDSLAYLYSLYPPCSGVYYSSQANAVGYVGFQVISGIQTSFGWINITKLHDDYAMGVFNLELGSFACENNISGIEHFMNSKEHIIIYPNPIQNSLQIVSKGQITRVEITDVLGKEVIDYKLQIISKKIEIDISNLKEGVYFLSVKTNSGTSTQKIIVQW
jgi:hypothetical protein